MSSNDSWSLRMLSVLRIVVGLLLVEHATMKFFAFPTAMPGPAGPLPGILVAAGVIELVGGTLITLGLFTRPAAFIASGLCAAAYFTAHLPKGFWPAVNQSETAIMFCFVFLYLVFAGPGTWSVDALLRRTPDAGRSPTGSEDIDLRR